MFVQVIVTICGDDGVALQELTTLVIVITHKRLGSDASNSISLTVLALLGCVVSGPTPDSLKPPPLLKPGSLIVTRFPVAPLADWHGVMVRVADPFPLALG